MRDPNRLYKFYNDLMRVHMENFPDLRFGQLISNFEEWMKDKKKIDDLFYVEEVHMMHFIDEFVEDMTIDTEEDDIDESLCWTCVYYPPSSFGGKPCCMCDTNDPMLNCYRKSEE